MSASIFANKHKATTEPQCRRVSFLARFWEDDCSESYIRKLTDATIYIALAQMATASFIRFCDQLNLIKIQ